MTEGGGEFIGPTQDRIKALADSLGVATFATYNTGKNLLYKDGKKTPYATDGPLGSVPPVDAAGLANAAIVQASLDDMAKTVPVDAPWTAAKAEEWDRQTFESWLRANAVVPSAKFLLDVACTSIFSAEPRELSLLFVLFYIAAAGNESTPGTLERLTETANGAQERRFVGGSQLVPVKLAATLGDRVALNAPVRTISRSGGKYVVTADGLTVTAKRVVVAVPPPLAARITYDPLLPADSRPAHPAPADGLGGQGHRDLRHPLLAGRRPQRPGGQRHRRDQLDLRQLPAGRLVRRADGLHRGRRGPQAGRGERGRGQGGGPEGLRDVLRRESGLPHLLRPATLEQRGLHPRRARAPSARPAC